MKLWGVFWVWGSSKRMVGGLVKSHDFYFAHYFDKICASNLLCRWESSFSYIFSQKSCENPMFQQFLVEKWFSIIFMYILDASKFPRARWLYDITVTTYEVQWYSFWYQWKEEIHTYTLVANIGVSGVPYRKSREGVATTPLRRTFFFFKIPREDEVKNKVSHSTNNLQIFFLS